MADIEHREVPAAEVHGALRPNFATKTARDADIGPYVSDQIGSLAYQVDSGNLYRLSSVTPITWDLLATGVVTATSDPTANDDVNDGYEVGQVWVNTTTDAFFICVDNASTAAVWSGGGGGSSTLQSAYNAGTGAIALASTKSVALSRGDADTGTCLDITNPGQGVGVAIGPSSSVRGQLALDGTTGDPTTTTEGDFWYNASDDSLKYYDGAATRAVVAADDSTGDVAIAGDLDLGVGQSVDLDGAGTLVTVPSVAGRWQIGPLATPNLSFNGSTHILRQTLAANGDAGINLGLTNSNRFASINASQRFRVAPLNNPALSNPMLEVATAAHTGMTADTEWHNVLFDFSSTVQFTAGGGAFANQRAFYVRSPTYDASAADTIVTAATVAIEGAPSPGPNMGITNPYALHVESGRTQLDGDLVHNGTNLGFFGGSATQQTVSGATGGNVALQNLLSALAAYNIIIDSTT